jgi:hypothetical protein
MILDTLYRQSEKNTFSLPVNQYLESVLNFISFENLKSILDEITNSAFVSYLLSDNEFADEQKEKFDAQDLVYSCLFEYETNLKKIGWQK